MTEDDFRRACEQVLTAIEDALDRCEVDVETDRQDLVLTLTFDDDSKIIVNGNTPLREIWVAARAGGFHFRWQDDRWRGTRDEAELFEQLSRWVSQQAGAPVRLAARPIG